LTAITLGSCLEIGSTAHGKDAANALGMAITHAHVGQARPGHARLAHAIPMARKTSGIYRDDRAN